MEYAKIIVKSNYEQRGDLVLRSYVRALKKVFASELLEGDNGLIYGMVDEFGRFYEFFTKNIIDYDNYVIVPIKEYSNICFLTSKQKEKIKKIIEKIIFEKDVDLNFEVSTIEELANDRTIEFEAYNNYLGGINPYMRLDDDLDNQFAYNSFQSKIKEINKMNIIDEIQDFNDEYDIANYENLNKVLIKK